MLNKPFETGTFEGQQSSVLMLEPGESYCLVSVISQNDRLIQGVKVYTYSLQEVEESIDQILASFTDSQSFDKVIISPAFAEALLVPRKFYKDQSSLLKSACATNDAYFMHDLIAEWQCVTDYAIPNSVYNKIVHQFPNAVFMHSYTPVVKFSTGSSTDYQLIVHFMYSQFRVLVKKQHQIHLIQTYSYASPMDVVYYLLKITAEFSLPVEETQILLSGFIDENSALYKELHSYFTNLSFATADTLVAPTEEHPSHFFTSIHNLAACVL